MSERFKVVLDHARRYTSARLYLFYISWSVISTQRNKSESITGLGIMKLADLHIGRHPDLEIA